MESLFSPLPGLREMAVMELPDWATYGRDVTDAVVISLQDVEPIVCRAAAMVAGRLRCCTPAILEHMEKRLATDDLLLRRTVVTALSRFGKPAHRLLVKLLADRDPFVRHFIGIALEQSGADGLDALLGALEQAHLRRSAGKILAHIGKPAIPHLLHRLHHPDPEVQYLAMDLLEEIGPVVVPTLIEQIRKGNADQTVGGDMLHRFGADAVPELVKMLRAPDVTNRCWAAAILVKIGRPSLTPLVDAVFGDDTSLCFIASQALVQIGAPAVPALMQALGTSTRSLRWIVSDILAKMGEEAIVALERMAVDGNPTERESAIHALGEMGSVAYASLPALERLAQEETNPTVRDLLQQTIARLQAFD